MKQTLNNATIPESCLASVSGSDLQTTADLVISFLKDKKCVTIPTRVLFEVIKIIEKKNITFTFKNVPKSYSNLFVRILLYCNELRN